MQAGRNYEQTNEQTDGRMNDLITICPRRTFQAEGNKILSQVVRDTNDFSTIRMTDSHHSGCSANISEFNYFITK